MTRMRWRNVRCVAMMLALTLAMGLTSSSHRAEAAGGFASPAFQARWQAGETVTPNFWGPLAIATDGFAEPYTEAPGGQRLVQYFDKGRMELTDPVTGTVSAGLLGKELVTGMIQTGDATYEQHPAPAVAIAGDSVVRVTPDGSHAVTPPSYADLNYLHTAFLDPIPSAIGTPTTRSIAVSTANVVAATFPNAAQYPQGVIAIYDAATGHNIPQALAAFRDHIGIATIGLAVAEPFWETTTVGGTPRDVLVQVFERRVLTYTPSNPANFRVEFGNTGLHYYSWRYGGSFSTDGPPPPLAQPVPPTNAPVTGVCAAPASATIVSSPTSVRGGVPVSIAARVFDEQGNLCGDGTRVIIGSDKNDLRAQLGKLGGGPASVIVEVQGGVALAVFTVPAGTPPSPPGRITVNVYRNDPAFYRATPSPIGTNPWQPEIL